MGIVTPLVRIRGYKGTWITPTQHRADRRFRAHKHAHMHARTHARARTRTHARAHPRARTRTCTCAAAWSRTISAHQRIHMSSTHTSHAPLLLTMQQILKLVSAAVRLHCGIRSATIKLLGRSSGPGRRRLRNSPHAESRVRWVEPRVEGQRGGEEALHLRGRGPRNHALETKGCTFLTLGLC